MQKYILILISVLLLSCSTTNELPTAKTLSTGEVVKTPRQYQEFCERDVDNICPEKDDAPEADQ